MATGIAQDPTYPAGAPGVAAATGDPRPGALPLGLSTLAAPVSPVPQASAFALPPIAPYSPPPLPSGVPGTIPTGQFQAPSATDFTQDPSYQWRLSQGLGAIQKSAAAHGTLLNGGTLKSLSDYAGNSASQEYGDAYTRALQTYNTNRDTNAQNFDQSQKIFGNTQTQYGNSVGAAQTQQANAQATLNQQTGQQNASADAYAQQLAAQRASDAAQNAIESARINGPQAGPLGGSPYATTVNR